LEDSRVFLLVFGLAPAVSFFHPAAMSPSKSWGRHAAGISVLLAVLRVTPSSAHEGQLRSSRHLTDAEGEFIWGVCDDWTHNVTGCSLEQGMQCSSFLSPGPEDADVEINITDLPPSLSGREVHLQWWSPRKSAYEYDPIQSPNGCAIYWDMRKAYPKHDDDDFNGGNVRVSEEGLATIRVHQPATYRVSKWVLYPHIHLRLCTGDNFAHANPDTIFFSVRGPVFSSGYHGQNHSAAKDMLASAMYLPGHEPTPGKKTPSKSDDSLLSNISGLDDLRIQDAKDALDLDALEFSPVYQCLLEGTFFSYYSSKCVESCPADADVHVGQCVRKSASEAEVTLQAIWALDLSCGETCWHDKLTVTLHHVRIAVADQLQIPFQEVEHASLGLLEATSRRLDDGTNIREARLQVRVRSQRVSAAKDGPLLMALLTTPEDASWLLGFQVHGVSAAANEEWKEEGYTVLTDASDPYSDAYKEEVQQSPGGGTASVLPMEYLPVEAIIGIAIAVILIGSVVATYLFLKRRKMTALAREGEIPVVTGRPAKSVDDDGPTKPTTVGAPTEDDDHPQKPQQDIAGVGLGSASSSNAAAAAAPAATEAADGSQI